MAESLPDRVKIIMLDGDLGVEFTRGPKHEAHAIRPEDWPVIDRIERKAKILVRGGENLAVKFDNEFRRWRKGRSDNRRR